MRIMVGPWFPQSNIYYSAFRIKLNLANRGKDATSKITLAPKSKSRKSLITTFSLILFLALC